MQLSDAIRLGSALFPPGFNGRMDGPTRCALAAASEAAGIAPIRTTDGYICLDVDALCDRFPILHEQITVRGAAGATMRLSGHIAIMNDYGFMTREQVADFVEQMEIARGYAPQVPDAVEAVRR